MNGWNLRKSSSLIMKVGKSNPPISDIFSFELFIFRAVNLGFQRFNMIKERWEHPWRFKVQSSMNVSTGSNFTAFTTTVPNLQFAEDLHPGERILQISFGSGFKCNSAVSCSRFFVLFDTATQQWIFFGEIDL